MTKNKLNKKLAKMLKRRKRRRTTRRHQEYKYTVKTPVIKFELPTYTQQNLKFSVYDLLYENSVFQQLLKSYNQFKLDKVTFFAQPRSIAGTDPAQIWIYLDANGENTQFNYANMPELQGSKALPVKRFSMTSFSSTGRQNDFHYWYDLDNIPLTTLAIRLHCDTEPSPDPDWQFQLGFVVKFRGLKAQDTAKSSNQKANNEQVVKLSESQVEDSKVQEPENQVDEDEEVWDHVDSDWDEDTTHE